MEKQLKVDVLLEAERYGGRFLLHDESEDGNLISFWVDTTAEGAVLTSREMFARCLNVDSHVHRIPITDEQAPLPSTFDQFVQELHCNKSGLYVLTFFQVSDVEPLMPQSPENMCSRSIARWVVAAPPPA